MSDFCEQPIDSLDALLTVVPSAPDAALRERLRECTLTRVRWQRRTRQLWRGCALFACYLAGLFTMHGIPTVVDDEPLPTSEHSTAIDIAPFSVPPSPMAERLEVQAYTAPALAAPLYRQAGDLYLAQEVDPESALRCYGVALTADPASAASVETTDSWLMIAIKNARVKEKDDAKRIH